MCARDGCFIVPPRVLRRLAEDESIPVETRQAMRDCVAVEEAWRGLRNAQTEAIQISLLASGITTLQVAGVLASVPAITVYDCKTLGRCPAHRSRIPVKARTSLRNARSIPPAASSISTGNALTGTRLTMPA